MVIATSPAPETAEAPAEARSQPPAAAQQQETALVAQPIAQLPILISVTEETIARRRAYLSLTIKGVEDKEGLAAVRAARMECVHDRNTIDKERKAQNEQWRSAIKRTDTEAARLTLLLSPIETHLTVEQTRIENEIARLARVKADEIYAQRAARLKEAGVTLMEVVVRAMSAEDFERNLALLIQRKRERDEAQAKADADEKERRRLANEEYERNKAERERLARLKAEQEEANRKEQERLDALKRQQEEAAQKERDRLAEIERKQRAESDRLAAEQKRLDDEAAQRQRQVELDKARAEAAEKARRETEARQARELEERAARQRKLEEDRQRAERLRPCRERLATVADEILKIAVPDDVPDDARPARTQIYNLLGQTAQKIRDIAASVGSVA